MYRMIIYSTRFPILCLSRPILYKKTILHILALYANISWSGRDPNEVFSFSWTGFPIQSKIEWKER